MPDGFFGFNMIIRVRARDPSQSRFALCLDVVLVGGDLQQGLGSILDAPHDYGTDVYWIANRVVHLERPAFQRLQSTRDLLLRIERIDPPKAGVVFGADVATEQ